MNIVLGLGSNLGARERQLWRAIDALRPRVDNLTLSPLYASAPVGVVDQPTFLNMTVSATYEGTVGDLLALVKRIEVDLGRKMRERFGPREIDIDLLLADGLVIDTPAITLPHPRLHERLFVLMPLADLVPNTVVPTFEKDARTLLGAHPDYSRRGEHCRLHLPACKREELTPEWLQQAFAHMGAFVFTNALPPELITELIDRGRGLLRLPTEKKSAFSKRIYEGGYTPSGVERVGSYGTDTEREFWDVPPLGRRNRFPRDQRRVRTLSRRVYDTLESLSRDTFNAIDHAHGTKLSDDARGGEHMLRMTRYFSRGELGKVIFPEHRDFGLLTFFCGGTAPGLEGEYAGTWHPITATHVAGDVLVGTGTTLQLYLKELKAFHHQVTDANRDPQERLSVSLFTEPRLDVVLPNGQIAGERLKRALERIRS